MSDKLTAALAAHDRELAALERLNEQIQAAPSYRAAAVLIVEFRSAKARVRTASSEVERQKALRDARVRIPAYRDESDETKGELMSRNWAVPPGGKHDTTYRPDRREFSYQRRTLRRSALDALRAASGWGTFHDCVAPKGIGVLCYARSRLRKGVV